MAKAEVKITVKVNGQKAEKVVLKRDITSTADVNQITNDAHRAIDDLRRAARVRAGV